MYYASDCLCDFAHFNPFYILIVDCYELYLASGRAVRKCGHWTSVKFCAHYNPYHHKLKITMGLPHARFARTKEEYPTISAHAVPANFETKLMEQGAMESYDDSADKQTEDGLSLSSLNIICISFAFDAMI